jgi:hypothetical protein
MGRERREIREVHHIENRLDLDLAEERPTNQPLPYARAVGYLLILAIAATVWYSAAL